MYAIIPSKVNVGISIHLLDIPGKSKVEIVKGLTIKVTRYKTMAAETHLKNPKVTKFSGNKRTFITGLARKDVAMNASPAINKVLNPLPKTMPFAIFDAVYNT